MRNFKACLKAENKPHQIRRKNFKGLWRQLTQQHAWQKSKGTFLFERKAAANRTENRSCCLRVIYDARKVAERWLEFTLNTQPPGSKQGGFSNLSAPQHDSVRLLQAPFRFGAISDDRKVYCILRQSITDTTRLALYGGFPRSWLYTSRSQKSAFSALGKNNIFVLSKSIGVGLFQVLVSRRGRVERWRGLMIMAGNASHPFMFSISPGRYEW